MLGFHRNNRGGYQIFESTYNNRPLTRVELHVHIGGSLRHETIWELAKIKGLPLPGKGTFEELVDYMVLKEPTDLPNFLKRFDIVKACLKGDLKALERIGYEFVEDCAKQGIMYSEARCCPHIFIPDSALPNGRSNDLSKKWVYDVTGAIIKGLKRGKAEFRSSTRLIMTSIRGVDPSWFEETLDIIRDKAFHNEWIVGIDMAALPETACESHMIGKEAVELFQTCVKEGIHRTVHAGESGGPLQVKNTIDLLGAERIGHGYSVLEDPSVAERVRKEGIHLECCPWSSLLTGAVPMTRHPHPVVTFFTQGYNVSVNTDDPMITGTRMDDEYSLLRKWGLCEAHFVKGNFNAARSSFLDEGEQKDLLQTLGKFYGFVM